jgi:two-component system invasion response regulator UvrY
MAADEPAKDTAARSVGVLVIDDQPFFHAAARAVIEAGDEFRLVGAARSGIEGVEAADELDPELVLLDVRMPVMDGIETARRIRERHADAVIVLLSVDDVASVPSSMASCGASAFVRKQDFGRGMLQRLWAVHGRHHAA